MANQYSNQIRLIYKKLISKGKFSLCRFGDGEWAGISKNPLVCGNNPSRGIYEWTTTGDNDNFSLSSELLSESLKYSENEYYVGICPCYTEMLKFSNQNEKNIVYANIFVNNNYSFFKEKFLEFFGTQKVHLVANKEANISNLPFSIEEFYPVEYNAWIYNLDLIDKINSKNYSNKLFLFCAGPLSNILCYKLWQNNKNNVYLDIGSTLDPWINTGNPRAYYLGKNYYSDFICPCPNVVS